MTFITDDTKGSVTADSAVPGCPSKRGTGGGKAASPRRNGRTANRRPIDEELEDEAEPTGPGPGQDPPAEEQATPAAAFARRTVTTTMVAIAALTFTFSFGNCWALGLRLGVAPWLAPLVGPSVDLSVIGLLVGIRHMQLRGVHPAELRPARILLAFSGLATLALNIAEPLAAGSPGRAAYDSIPPLLLIGWAEVGPGLLSRLHQAGSPTVLTATIGYPSPGPVPDRPDPSPTPPAPAALLPVAAVARSAPARSTVTVRARTTDSTARTDNAVVDDALLETARRLDTEHRARTGGRPISAETLRKELRIGAARARVLSKNVRR